MADEITKARGIENGPFLSEIGNGAIESTQLNEQSPPQRQICQDHDFEDAELYYKVEYLEFCGVVLVS